MTAKFKINDIVEVPFFNKPVRKDWVVVGFASNDTEAVIVHLGNGSQTTMELSKLKHQEN